MPKRFPHQLCLWGSFALPVFGWAQTLPAEPPSYSHRTLQASKLETPPIIDGDISDACWQTLPTGSVFIDEQLGTPFEEDTHFWLGYDDRFIYIAVRCFDQFPQRIVARQTKLNGGFDHEDMVWFRINPFNNARWDDQSKFEFNALGTQNAYIAGGRASKLEWQGAWKAAAKIDAQGWTGEAAIPWSILSRPSGNGKPANMGFNFGRYHARQQKSVVWSYLGPQGKLENSGEWLQVTLPPPSLGQRLSVLGYAYGGVNTGQGGAFRAGLDARYLFTSQLTGVASINPDFSNVEGDITSLDFTYAEQLPGERRPFFLEGRSFFDNGYFTSVRVPEFDWGTKLYGKLNSRTDVGLLATNRIGRRLDSVLSFTRQLSIGNNLLFDLVSRHDEDFDNDVFSAAWDGRVGDYFLYTQGAFSNDSGKWGDRFSASLYRETPPNHDTTRTVGTFLDLNLTDQAFIARDGYVPFTDELGFSGGAFYNIRPQHGWLRSYGFNFDLRSFQHLSGGFFRDGFSIGFSARTRSDFAFGLSQSWSRFEENDDRLTWLSLGYPATNASRHVSLDYSFGRQGGYDYSSLTPSINWRFSRQLIASLSTQFVELDRFYHQEIFSLNYDFSPERGIGGRIVNRDGNLNGYVSFRNSGYGGLEYFLIVGDPNADSFQNRVVFKVIRPF